MKNYLQTCDVRILLRTSDLSCARAENAPWLRTFCLISELFLFRAILEETSALVLPVIPKIIFIFDLSKDHIE